MDATASAMLHEVFKLPRVSFMLNRSRVANPLEAIVSPGAGLTTEQGAAFDVWRENYWSWRATQELAKRRLDL